MKPELNSQVLNDHAVPKRVKSRGETAKDLHTTESMRMGVMPQLLPFWVPFFKKLCLTMLLLAGRGVEAQLLLIAVISNNPPDSCRGQCF